MNENFWVGFEKRAYPTTLIMDRFLDTYVRNKDPRLYSKLTYSDSDDSGDNLSKKDSAKLDRHADDFLKEHGQKRTNEELENWKKYKDVEKRPAKDAIRPSLLAGGLGAGLGFLAGKVIKQPLKLLKNKDIANKTPAVTAALGAAAAGKGVYDLMRHNPYKGQTEQEVSSLSDAGNKYDKDIMEGFKKDKHNWLGSKI